MDARRYAVLVLTLATIILTPFTVSAVDPSGPAADINAANMEASLRKQVNFWIGIYTQYSTSEGLVHDAKYPDVIYEKLDFRAELNNFKLSPHAREQRMQNRIKSVKEFYKRTLLSIHKKKNDPDELNPAEKRVAELFRNISEPNKFFSAAHNKRIRYQLGQRDRFLQGLFYSGRYLPMMEKVFRDRGIPVGITRLPFVESSFNLKARSKVGASGIWQFMRSTGKFYLKINDTLDERNDPIRATEAAAGLLKLNYDSLGSWPLAITAYNHGRKGLMRAVRKIGSSDLDDIISSYRSRSFGFASSNFFTEFIAAAEVEKNAEKYFGKVERDKPAEFAEFVMNDYVRASDLATYTRIPIDTLMELNPALTDLVFNGKRLIPRGYALRIPAEAQEKFLARYGEMPASKKFSKQTGPEHDLLIVRSGRGKRKS